MFQRTPSVIEDSGVLVEIPTQASQARLPPFVYALAAHLAGFATTWAMAVGVGLFGGVSVPLLFSAIFEGGTAAFLSYRWGMHAWWIPIQFLFFPVLLGGLALDISPSVFLALFLATVLVYWSVFRTQVPLYFSSCQAWRAVAEVLPHQAGVRVIDLGSGIGGLLKYLAGARQDAQLVGVEAAPLPFLVGWLRTLGRSCRMHFGSLWDVDLVGFDVAYAYLSPVPMAKLWEKVQREMRPGSLFISNTFAVPDVIPAETVQLDDFHQSILYIYRL